MNAIISRMALTGLLFLVTLGSGIVLSRAGKPLNSLIFTIHKLAAVAAVVFTVIIIRNFLKSIEMETTTLILVIVTGLSLLLMFASGAFLSIVKPVNSLVLTVHAVVSILTVVSTALTVYILFNRV